MPPILNLTVDLIPISELNLNEFDLSTTEYLNDLGISTSPKRVKLLAMIYLGVLFCLGIHVEWKRLESTSNMMESTPTSILLKETENNDDNLNMMSKVGTDRVHNILTLGGSNTWGSKLEERRDAFPHVLNYLKQHKVTNRAIEASGSFYPSICIESFLKNSDDNNDDTEYDVILMEFSMSGFHNFDILIKRLQYRFPNAVFVYVHLYSLRAATTQEPAGSLIWKNKDLTLPGVAVQILFDEIGGYVYSLPSPSDPNSIKDFFTEEMTHLSEVGHFQVGEDLAKLLENVYIGTKEAHEFDNFDHQWGYGDECKNWFVSGKLPNEFKYHNAKMKHIDYKDPTDAPRKSKSRNVLEFHNAKAKAKPHSHSKSSATITMRHHLNIKEPVPVFFSFVVPANQNIKVAITMSDGISDKTVVLESTPSPHMVVEIQEVGLAKQGKNIVRIELLEDTQSFQLVGIAFYGFRFHRGLPMKRMHNTIIIDNADASL